MADTMQFELVAPERKLASGQASEVQIPGSEGDLTAMPDHAPTITTLRPGILRIVSADGDLEFLVTGGFAEITATSASVLAEHALPRDEVTQQVMDALMSEARETLKTAPAETLDAATKLVADMAAVAEALGLSTAS